MWRRSLALLLLASCEGTKTDTTTDVDAPADADTDADSDSDADTDADSDSDADTDADTDPTRPSRCDDPGPDAPVVQISPFEQMDFQGFPVVYTVPEDPVGVVFYFIGGADLSELQNHEQIAMLWNLLWSEGFGIVATMRTDPGAGGRWDWNSAWAQNADAQRLHGLRDHLIATTPLEDTTPVALTGFSDGTGMVLAYEAELRTHGWPIFAVTAHNGAFGVDPPRVPTLFLYGENDSAQAVSGLDFLLRQMDRDGTHHEEVELPERVATPEVFLRHADWDQEKAEEVFDDLVAHGLIDAQGRRQVPDADMESALDDYSRQSAIPGAAIASTRMHVVWAMHRYSAFEAERECNFVLDQLP